MSQAVEAGFNTSEVIGLPHFSEMKEMSDVLLGAGATSCVVLILLYLPGRSQPFGS